MGAPVVHFELNAGVAKKAQEFYASVFEWKVDASNPMAYGLIDTGVKMGINGGIGQAQGSVPAGPVFYVQVEDLQACLSKAEGLGARTVVPPTDIPGMVTFAMFADPEGHMIGLVKGMQAPPKKTAPPRKKASPARRKAAKPKRKAARGRKR